MREERERREEKRREERRQEREKGRERRGDREEKKNKINNKKYNENTSTYTRGEGVTFACVRRLCLCFESRSLGASSREVLVLRVEKS